MGQPLVGFHHPLVGIVERYVDQLNLHQTHDHGRRQCLDCHRPHCHHSHRRRRRHPHPLLQGRLTRTPEDWMLMHWSDDAMRLIELLVPVWTENV